MASTHRRAPSPGCLVMNQDRVVCPTCGGLTCFDTNGQGQRVEWCIPNPKLALTSQRKLCPERAVQPWTPWIGRDPAPAPASDAPAAEEEPSPPAAAAPRCPRCGRRMGARHGQYQDACSKCRRAQKPARASAAPTLRRRCDCGRSLRRARTDGQQHTRCFTCRTRGATPART